MLWKGAKSVDMDEQVVCRVFTEGGGGGEGADVVHGHARQCGPKRGCSSLALQRNMWSIGGGLVHWQGSSSEDRYTSGALDAASWLCGSGYRIVERTGVGRELATRPIHICTAMRRVQGLGPRLVPLPTTQDDNNCVCGVVFARLGPGLFLCDATTSQSSLRQRCGPADNVRGQ